MNFPDKYHLTLEQSTFLPKKKWDEQVSAQYRVAPRAGAWIEMDGNERTSMTLANET